MRRAVLLILWLVTDYLLFLATYAIAYVFRVGWILSSDLPLDRYLISTALGGLLWLCALVTTRTFGLTRNQGTGRNAAYIGYAAVVGVAFVSLTYFFLYKRFFSRALVALAMILSAIVTWAWHLLYEQMLRRSLRKNPPAFPTLLVGVTRESRKLLETMNARLNPLKPVAILDAAGTSEKEIAGVPVVGRLNKLEDILASKKITHLIQCSDLEQSLNLLSACRARGITYMLLPSVLGIVERDERLESLEGKAVTVVGPSAGWWDWFFR